MAVISNVEIKIDGKPVKDFDLVLIEQSLYDIDNFEITCRYDTVEKSDSFLITNSKEYLGSQIIIQANIKAGSSDKDVLFMKGFVTDIQGTRTGMADNDKIVISGGSEEILLNGKPTSRAFTGKTLEDIVKEVVKPYPVKDKIKINDKFQYPYIVQFEESDLEFLKRLSSRYGEWFFFKDGKMIFGELPVPDREEKLTIGYDLLDFSYSLRVSPVKFKLVSNDPVKTDVYRYKAGDGKVEQVLTEFGKFALGKSKKLYPVESLHYYKSLNVNEADFQKAIQKAGERDEESDASNLSFLSGTSINPLLMAGMQIKVDCPGNVKTSPPVNYGVYLVTSVRHSFDNLLSYKNSFNAIPEKIKVPGNTNPYFIKASHEQIGIVTDNQDPKMLGRIRVRFPWMDNNSQTPWIPMTTPYAQENSGIYFLPSVNSRVLVGFEGADVEKPYCIGALIDQSTAPDSAWTGDYNSKDSKIQAIRSLSGQTIELHDEPGKEKITIYDTKNKNEITLDSATGCLTIRSADKLVIEAKEIEIKAQAGMKIEAGQSLLQKAAEIKSEAQVVLEAKAASVEIKSDGALKASGKATAEISSSGVMTVKGSVVMIN